ncbi:MAG: hypothetical protein ACI361_03495 [Atopobiaceae bacterium]
MDKEKRGGEELLPLSLFIDEEDGYTSVAVAVALLVSFALVFSLAAAGWALARSADIQGVADAAALSASQAVGAYSSCVQVLDAAARTLGTAGMLMVAAGMVAAAVPGGQAAGAASADTGMKLLQTRRHLVQTASQGLSRLEKILPLLIIRRGMATIAAQSTERISYQGIIVPYPVAGTSDFSGMDQEVDEEGLDEATSALSDASKKAQEAQKEAEGSKEEAWRADCAEEPYCLRERAAKLAGLPDALNPYYPSPASWSFGAPLMRARAYYAARLAQEQPTGTGVEEETRSAIRSAYYRYAEERMKTGHYEENPDGTVDMDLPALPHTADETRDSTLFTESIWPTSEDADGTTLHAYAGCPARNGGGAGTASLADLEAGRVRRCPVCGLDTKAVGQVASATTNTKSGFEHWWRIIEEASKRYQKARAAMEDADSETHEAAGKAKGRFDEALEVLKSADASFCPPGAWGTVALVSRPQETAIPESLTSDFLASASLSAGAAISAAVLAPVETGDASVLMDSVHAWEQELGEPDSAVAGIVSVWNSVLAGYGEGWQGVEDVADTIFDGIGGVFGGSAAAWLRDRLREGLGAAGLEPADLRPRRPVLTSTKHVLVQAGLETEGERERLLGLLDEDASAPERLASALGIVSDALPDGGKLEVAELLVPGGTALPLSIGLGSAA